MSHLSDLEDSLNMIIYVSRESEPYRDTTFDILETQSGEIIVMFQGKPLLKEFSSKRDAYCYAIGYIDGMLDREETQ